MNPMKAGLAGLVMTLASMMSPSESEARNNPSFHAPRPIATHHQSHNRQYWSNYNLRTFYGYPQFQQQKWTQPIPNTYIQNLEIQKNRTVFYQMTDSVYGIYQAGFPVQITIFNHEGKIRMYHRTDPCERGGDCSQTEIPMMAGPGSDLKAPIGWHYKLDFKQE